MKFLIATFMEELESEFSEKKSISILRNFNTNHAFWHSLKEITERYAPAEVFLKTVCIFYIRETKRVKETDTKKLDKSSIRIYLQFLHEIQKFFPGLLEIFVEIFSPENQKYCERTIYSREKTLETG